MKKIKWMDVVIASPMVLTFASAGGGEGILISSIALVVVAGLLRCGGAIKVKSEETKLIRHRVTSTHRI